MPVNVFGAGAVQTAYVSYVNLDLGPADITLVWPNSYVNVPYVDPVTGIHYDVLAASITVNTPALNFHTITLPDATQASVGQNFIISNVGESPFNLLFNDETEFFTVTNGISYWVQLTDNSTTNGTWAQITFGAGTSAADPIALAGPGLIPYDTKLATNIPTQAKAVPYTVLPADRASLIVWTAGAGTITLPAVGDVDTGFYVSINNAGDGELTLQPTGDDVEIDNVANLVIEVAQSLTAICDGTNWWSLGFGQSQFESINALNKDVSGNNNVTLTGAESAYTIQQYTGVLTGNIKVFFPVVTNYWYVANLTTGNFTLSVQLGTPGVPVGQAHVVGQQDRLIFYSDGTGLYVIPTEAETNATFANGTTADPSITFTNDTSTGFSYSPDPVSLNISVGGVLQATAIASGIAMPENKLLTLDNGSGAAPSLTFSGSPTTGLFQIGNATSVAATGALVASFPTAGLLMANGKNIVIPNAAGTTRTTISTDPANGGAFSYTTGAFTSSLFLTAAGSAGQLTLKSAGTPNIQILSNINGAAFIVKGNIFSSQMNLNGAGSSATLTLSTPDTPAAGTASIAITNANGMVLQYAADPNIGTLYLSGTATSTSLRFNDTLTGLSILSNSGPGNAVFYNNTVGAIQIDPTGVVTFPGANAATLTALMPASVNGALAYYNGAAWVTLPPGTAGQTLTMAGGIPTWA